MDNRSDNAAFDPVEPLNDEATTSRLQESVDSPRPAPPPSPRDRFAGTRSAFTDSRR